ncbi:hypothetical protein GGX14DRAFT_432281, partial [Mycena pura]
MHAASTHSTCATPGPETSVCVGNQHQDVQPVDLMSNGPQCAHCGWRGGSHAANCPFSASNCPLS